MEDKVIRLIFFWLSWLLR